MIDLEIILDSSDTEYWYDDEYEENESIYHNEIRGNVVFKKKMKLKRLAYNVYNRGSSCESWMNEICKIIHE